MWRRPNALLWSRLTPTAWAPRIKAGVDALYTAALKGKNAMPPKGGNQNLTEAEVQRAVVYMANRSGASFKGPPAPTETAATAAAPPAAPASPAFFTSCTTCTGNTSR